MTEINLTIPILALAVVILFMFFMVIFCLVRRHYPTSMSLELMDRHNFTACECDLINENLADWTDEEIEAVPKEAIFLGNLHNLREIAETQEKNEHLNNTEELKNKSK